jgi:Fe-S cluster assembly protein SufD
MSETTTVHRERGLQASPRAQVSGVQRAPRVNEESYLKAFDATAKQRDQEPSGLRTLRQRAIERFAELGFPTTHEEQWKFTNVGPLATKTFTRGDGRARDIGGAALAPYGIGVAAAPQVVFVDGRYSPELSTLSGLPAGLVITNLNALIGSDPGRAERYVGRLASYQKHSFVALNTALFEDGAFVSVAPGTVLDRPIHVLYVSTTAGRMAHPRVVIVAGEHAQVQIVESYAGITEAEYFTNAVTEVSVGPAAVVDHYKVQRESFASFHMATMHVHLERDANFASHSLALGGGLVRNDIVAVMGGEGIDCTLNGLYAVDGDRLIDNHTTIDHALPHCGSHEVYKGILAGKSSAVFNGKIIVRPDAQKTDAKQTNKALLLSDDATINTKPELEIFANDVKCTHGAAIGQLDEDAVFYLRARGIGQLEARNLLIHAFAGQILDRVKIEPLRHELQRVLDAQLGVTLED